MTDLESESVPVSSSVTEMLTAVESEAVPVGLSSAKRQSKLPSPVTAEKVTDPTSDPLPQSGTPWVNVSSV
ncbi:MAG TPA: hypothetical protein VH228_00450, partial [Nocardioides sp.]|nr:hypothetical protein [Nocardioides sp.]